MKSLMVICALVFCAGQKADTWLNIVKSEDGYLFRGHLENTEFSFDIPGDQIHVARQEESGDSAVTSIDDIFFAVMPVRKSEFPATGPDFLSSYRKSEQQYQKRHFGRASLSDLDVCKGATLRHESWELETLDLKAPAQVYMAVKAGNYVLVASSAFSNAGEKGKMLDKFSSFCKSFKITQAR